jgi:hypothetical protein
MASFEGAPLRSGRTGDLDGNLRRVARELARIRFPIDFDEDAARDGNPMALLPALHYALLGFSRHVTGSLSDEGHDLHAKTDARFVEHAWKALRESFGYNPSLTTRQARSSITLVPIRPRSRGERRSLRTLPGASLRPSLAVNPRPRSLSTPLLTPFNSTPTFARSFSPPGSRSAS